MTTIYSGITNLHHSDKLLRTATIRIEKRDGIDEGQLVRLNLWTMPHANGEYRVAEPPVDNGTVP